MMTARTARVALVGTSMLGAFVTFVVGADEQYGLAMRGTAAESRAALAGADRLLGVLRSSDVLTHSPDFNTVVHRVTGTAYPGFDTGMPFHYGVIGALRYTSDGGEVPLRAVVNMAACDEVTADTALDGGPPVIIDYRQTGEFRGHAIYNGDCIFITNRGVPALVPVTKDRYFKLAILKLRARQEAHRNAAGRANDDSVGRAVARVRQLGDSLATQQIRDVEAQLAAMPPEERREQAAVLNNDQLLPSSLSEDGAMGLMQPNPAFFDRSLAPEVPQLIVVVLPGLQGDVEPSAIPLNAQRARDVARIKAQLDWAALEAMVRAQGTRRGHLAGEQDVGAADDSRPCSR